MVDDRMRSLGVTSRDLATKLSTSKKSITHTTIWAWTKNTDGFPPTATYTEEINRKMAHALDIKPEILAQAFEDSRRHLIMADRNAAERGRMSILRRLFADSKQSTWKRAEILQLIDDITGN